jgi:hypothetical protein
MQSYETGLAERSLSPRNVGINQKISTEEEAAYVCYPWYTRIPKSLRRDMRFRITTQLLLALE